MSNTINNATIQLVETYEGCVLQAYPDPASKDDPVRKGAPWTIGYGHTGGLSLPTVKEGDVITQAQAQEYLMNDLNVAGSKVAALVQVELNDNQFGALVSFFFNVGETTFAQSSVLSYVNQGNFNAVPGRLALYRLADGKVLEGLVRRRQAEGQLWLTPVDNSQPATNTVPPKTTVAPDQNGKTGVSVGTLGAGATMLSTLSFSIKSFVQNFTDTFHVSPIVLVVIVGLGFIGYELYQKNKKDK